MASIIDSGLNSGNTFLADGTYPIVGRNKVNENHRVFITTADLKLTAFKDVKLESTKPLGKYTIALRIGNNNLDSCTDKAAVSDNVDVYLMMKLVFYLDNRKMTVDMRTIGRRGRLSHCRYCQHKDQQKRE